jgi:membrane protease YdiL (CAAX protease family)
MIMGYLTMVRSFALHWVAGRLAPLRYAVPDVLQQFPAVTLLAIVFTVSAVAGIVEEAASRGYMQGPTTTDSK